MSQSCSNPINIRIRNRIDNIIGLKPSTHPSLTNQTHTTPPSKREFQPFLSSLKIDSFQPIHQSPKFTLRYLARIFEKDQRTVLGSTLASDCGVLDIRMLTPKLVKNGLAYAVAPAGCEWKESLAFELMDMRDSEVQRLEFSFNEIDDMLTYVCTS